MRSFYIKEKLFAIGVKFVVLNENNDKEFIIEADKFDIGKNIKIYDMHHNRVLHMKQKLRIGPHKYKAFDGDKNHIATIKKSFIFPRYHISGPVGHMTMKAGLILRRHYKIIKDGEEVGRIDKKYTFGRDRYYLDVRNDEDTHLFLGLLAMIDMVSFYKNRNGLENEVEHEIEEAIF